MMTASFEINGKRVALSFEPGSSLLDVLRDAGLYGTKRGCNEGTCCSCVVLVDGTPQMACLLFAGALEGCSITTIEALDARLGRPHPLIQAFADAGAVQCGYCTPGMILSALALLRRTPDPSENEIKRCLDGHLCRCTGYVKQIEAIQQAAAQMRQEA